MYLFLRLEFIGWHPIWCCLSSFYHFPDPLIMLSIGGTGTMLYVISGGVTTSCAGTGAGSLSRQLSATLYLAPSHASNASTITASCASAITDSPALALFHGRLLLPASAVLDLGPLACIMA